MSKLIVTGVDGNFGGQVMKEILTLARKEDLILTAPFGKGLEPYAKDGFTTRVANFNHTEGLVEAFRGGDALLIISAPFVGEKRQNAHRNAIDAAKAAGVKKVVYTSLVNAADPTNPSIEKIDHAYTEAYLQTTGLDYVFLRNSQYAEAMITAFLTSNGVMYSCQGEGRMSYISRRDCAIAAAHALARADVRNLVLNVNGPESLTLAEFVAIGNRETKSKVKVENVPEEAVYAAFDALGVPRTTEGQFKKDSAAPYSSDGMVTFARAIRLGKMKEFTKDFETLTGKKPRTVAFMFAHADDYQVGARNSTDA